MVHSRVLNTRFRGLNFVLGCWGATEGCEQGRGRGSSGCLQGSLWTETGGFYPHNLGGESCKGLFWGTVSPESELGCRQKLWDWGSSHAECSAR